MIEVGEYIRTKSGLIDRIAYITDTMGDRKLVGFEKSNYCRSDLGIEKDIVKHSKDILDLIENEDILKVKTKENEIIYIGVDENTTDLNYEEVKEEIKAKEYQLLGILPHKQFEQNCYTVERKEEC